MTKKIINYFILLIIIPALVISGCIIFREKQYAFVSAAVTILACGVFLLSFEKKEHSAQKLTIIAALTAICIVSRIIFTPLQGFKPVTAIIIISSLHFGAESGFMVGAMTALISNFYLSQGPWTPFQMLTWGLIGFFAGLLSERLKKNKAWLLIYGAIAGILFSMLMDIYSVLWYDGGFNLSRYIASVISSIRFTVIYAISNVIFLLILANPIEKKLERIKDKYIGD